MADSAKTENAMKVLKQQCAQATTEPDVDGKRRANCPGAPISTAAAAALKAAGWVQVAGDPSSFDLTL